MTSDEEPIEIKLGRASFFGNWNPKKSDRIMRHIADRLVDICSQSDLSFSFTGGYGSILDANTLNVEFTQLSYYFAKGRRGEYKNFLFLLDVYDKRKDFYANFVCSQSQEDGYTYRDGRVSPKLVDRSVIEGWIRFKPKHFSEKLQRKLRGVL
jgi:hypothetical protein